jgi:3-phenylpropionate/cinnamic acid dioxygenase small subunit
MTAAVAAELTADRERELTRLVHLECRLIDEGRLDEWLDLWAPECRYFVPSGDYVESPLRVALVRDDRDRLEERVFRLTHSDAHAQEPRSRTTHLVANVEVEATGEDAFTVHCVSVVVEVRNDYQEVYSGRTRYVIGREAGGLRIREKTVHQLRNDQLLGNVTFIL